MGLFSFIKDAGEKLFGHKSEGTPEEIAQHNQTAAQAIFDHINSLGLQWANLMVSFDQGQVTITGQAPDQENREKIILAAGNVEGVDNVNDQLTVDSAAAEPVFYTVVKGDNLSKIAKAHYGDANKYPAIFEANKPMLTHPDKIYPGQNLRIPPL